MYKGCRRVGRPVYGAFGPVKCPGARGDVVFEIELRLEGNAGFVVEKSKRGACVATRNDDIADEIHLGERGAFFIQIISIHLHTPESGIIDEVVDDEGAGTGGDDGISELVMGKEILLNEDALDAGADNHAGGVDAFGVKRLVEGFGHDAATYGDIVISFAPRLHVFINGPGEGAVFYKDVVAGVFAVQGAVDLQTIAVAGIGAGGACSGADSDVADNDVVRTDANAIADECNAWRGSGGSVDGDIRVANEKDLAQPDFPGDGEADDPGLIDIKCGAKGAGAGFVKTGDGDDAASFTATRRPGWGGGGIRCICCIRPQKGGARRRAVIVQREMTESIFILCGVRGKAKGA